MKTIILRLTKVSYLYSLIFLMITLLSCAKENPTQYNTNNPPVQRTYVLHVPPTYTGENDVPLLVALHGYTSNGQQLEQSTQLDVKSDEEGFIVVYPDALAYYGSTMWNAGDMYEQWTNGTDDVDFISSLIIKLSMDYMIDSNRIFITGHSNGSFMAYRLACELSDKIAAIAPVCGQMVSNNCYPENKVSIIEFHALNDLSVPYNGSNINGLIVPPVETVIESWIGRNQCSLDADTICNENGVVGREWYSEEGSGDIVLYTNPTSGHNWPTHSNASLSGNDLMWDFFEAHPKK